MFSLRISPLTFESNAFNCIQNAFHTFQSFSSAILLFCKYTAQVSTMLNTILHEFLHSVLNMSVSNLSMGTVPMVFLKNNSSIMDTPTRRSDGSSRSNRPNRATWLGYWDRVYSPSMSWAWSWIVSIWCGSLRPLVAGMEEEFDGEPWLILLI